MPEEKKKVKAPIDEMLDQVLDKIEDADSILVTLSRDPSVDEMATALALTMALDGIGKHATAIYSGKTPNVLKFLKPEKTFETDTNSLQDFIIALNKEKADHLRYKVEGDFVKVYITPYKTTITEKDLEFSRGDINVDLVICLNVTSPEELDKALEEHGRILHDAVLINISNGTPGQIGGLEWNNDKASSVAEMATEMLDAMQAEYSPNVATALLTGVIAATDRFSNEKTTPDAMAISSRLMQKGADQQLIASNMIPKPQPKVEQKEEEIAPDSIDADQGDKPSEAADEKTGESASENALAESVPEVKEPEVEPMPVEPAEAEKQLTPEQELERMISGSNADLNNLGSANATNDLMAELVEAAKDKENKEKTEEKAPEQENVVEEDKKSEQEEETMEEQKPENNIPDVGQVLSVNQEKSAPAAAPAAAEAPVPEVAPAMPEQPAANPVMQAVPPTPEMPPVQPVAQPAMAQPVQPVAQPMAQPMQPMQPASQPVIPQPVAQPMMQAAPQAPTTPITAGTQMGYIPDGAKQALAGDVDMSSMQAAVSTGAVPTDSVYGTAAERTGYHDGTVDPLINEEKPKDYGEMMEAALAEATPTISLAPAQPVPQPVTEQPVSPAVVTPQVAAPQPTVQPVAAPAEPSVDDMVNQMVSQAQANNPINLPPPPAPPIPALPTVQPVAPAPAPVATPVAGPDPSAASGIPTEVAAPQPVAEPVNPVVVQPVQDPALVQPVQDPGAFKIPGM